MAAAELYPLSIFSIPLYTKIMFSNGTITYCRNNNIPFYNQDKDSADPFCTGTLSISIDIQVIKVYDNYLY